MAKRETTIRPLTDEDIRGAISVHIAAVHGLARAHYPPEVLRAWSNPEISEARVAHFQANSGGECRFVAERSGEIVGFGALDPAPRDNSYGELVACYVAPDTARGGVGRALVDAIEEEARGACLPGLQLEASLTAEPFYRALGYTPVRYYDRPLKRANATYHMAAVFMTKSF